MSVERYKFYMDEEADCFCEIDTSPDGNYVRYTDYQKLEAQLVEARAESKMGNIPYREAIQLKQALESISNYEGKLTDVDAFEMRRIARQALKGGKECAR